MGLLGRLLGNDKPEPQPADDGAVLVNAYATLRTLPPLDFPHELHSGRDLSDPELAEHLDGFVGYVMSRGDGQMTAARYHLWRHIQRVRHQLSFSVANEDLPAIEGWAQRANAVLFLPDGSVRAPDGGALMTGDGESDPEAHLPYPPDAVARREATLAALDGITPRPPASMPPSLGEAEVELRSAAEVRARALGLFCAAAHGHAVASEDPDVRPMLREQNPEGMAALTPKEAGFLAIDAPGEQATLDMGWRFEALNVLLWALGDTTADIERGDVVMYPDTLTPAALALAASPATPTPRPIAEILDALDMAWRQHWIARQARQNALPELLSLDVIAERHYALNWLTGFHNPPGTDWDEIDTPS
jgi:hypothetical protein